MKEWSCYTSINQLPFSLYKRLTIDGDLDALVISGNVPHETLESISDDIKDQFNAAIMGRKYTERLGDAFEIEKSRVDIVKIISLLELYDIYPCVEVVELLKEAGIKAEWGENYRQFVENTISTMTMAFEQKKQRFEAHAGDEDQAPPDHQYYTNIMIDISEMVKHEVPDTITTAQFCAYYNRLIQHIEIIKKTNGRRQAQ